MMFSAVTGRKCQNNFIKNIDGEDKITISHSSVRKWTTSGSQELEDNKGVIRIHKLKKNRQHNGQKIKDNRTNNDLQNITHKTKIEQHEPHSKPGVNLGACKCR